MRNIMSRFVAAAVIAVTPLVVWGTPASANLYYCSSTIYGGSQSGSTVCGGYVPPGPSEYRVRLRCDDLDLGTSYYRYGLWRQPPIASYASCYVGDYARSTYRQER